MLIEYFHPLMISTISIRQIVIANMPSQLARNPFAVK